MLSSPEFWVAVAFVILVASVYRPMARGITGALDQQSAKIGASLDQATQLREEAQHLLAEYQRKQRNAETESEEIIAQARSQADRLAAEAAANLEAALKRREQAAIEKIAQAEAEALDEVRGTAVDVAIAATRSLMRERLYQDRGQALIDRAIKELPDKLH